MTVYDVLIVGGGPAGLSAATALVRQLHTVVVFDSGEYRNAETKHMHNLAGWDHQDPADFRAKARKDLLARYQTVTFEDTEVASLKEIEGGFEAADKSGKTWQGKKVILATGVVDEFPDIAGYAECWGKGLYHCLYCHGYEERDRGSAGVLAVGMVANPGPAMQVSRNAAQLCGHATIFTNGSDQVATELTAAAGDSGAFKIDSRAIKRLTPAPEGRITVEFEDGSSQTLAFLVHAPFSHPRGPFVEQLGLETGPPVNDIKVAQPFLQTSKRGVFAAGDNMIMAKAVPIALSNGSMAAVGVASQLQAEKHGHKPMF